MKSGMLGRCGGCLFEWPGTTQSHCGACHEHFSSPASFDRHRMDFECLPVERFSELMKKQDGSPGKPRLVKSERSGHAIWVTELGSYLKGAESDRQSGTSEVSE